MRTGINSSADARLVAARSFVRSLTILLKFSRLYGFEHVRTTTQFQTTWYELRAAVPADDETGMLLGAIGSQLLLDGVPMETRAERDFAQLLSTAGISSIHFSSSVTQTDLTRLVRSFPSGRAKPAALAEQLKTALADAAGIRVNEIRFVAEDPTTADARISAQIIARTMGPEAEQFKAWLNDPQKLLQLIAAAEGSRSGSKGGDKGPGAAASGGGTAYGVAASPAQQEAELLGVLQALARIGQLGERGGGAPDPGLFQQQLSNLPSRAQDTIRQALANLAAQTPAHQTDEPVLVKLAEHMAIRFALDRFERGEVRVNAVRQMLDRMGQEIVNLRKVLGTHEERMARAGLLAESYADILDRQFWAAVPEGGKRSVLLSPEAWCIPPRNVRQYVEELLARGEADLARQILQNYASCITREEAEARRKTAAGLGECADLYGGGDASVLQEAIRQVGVQLAVERDAELQSMVSAAFVRLSQEAAKHHRYLAIQQVFGSLDAIEGQRPAFAQSLRPRIGIESRVPEFLDEALRAEHIPQGLSELLRLMPHVATDQAVLRFSRCGFREDSDRLLEIVRELGPEGVAHLRETLRAGADAEAAETLGLLSRLDMFALAQFLPDRLRMWPRSAQDRAVRQLAAGGAPEASRLLLAAFDRLDPLIMSLVLDEVGMFGDASAADRLMELAEGKLPELGTPYLRVKAIEALARLRATAAVPLLRHIAEARQVWRWAHPSELRIAALQALQKLDAEWVAGFLPRSGLTAGDLSMAPLDPARDSPWIRQRRYPRLRLAHPLPAVTTNLKQNCRLEIKEMNLGGGLAAAERHLTPSTVLVLKLNPGLRPLRFQAIVRNARAQAIAFEVAGIDLEERGRLRRLLLELGSLSGLSSSSRFGQRPPEEPPAAS